MQLGPREAGILGRYKLYTLYILYIQNINGMQWTLTPCIYIQCIPAFTPTVYSVLYTRCGPVPQAHSGDAGWADKHVDSLLLHCLPLASPYQFKYTLLNTRAKAVSFCCQI